MIRNGSNKRILITSTDVMMLQFLLPHIFELQMSGYDVDVACSNVENHIEELHKIFDEKVKFTVVQLCRNPFTFSNIKGFFQLKKIIDDGKYDLIWTNEPVMGAVTRLAARKSRKRGSKVMYIAHGFHFYKGALKLNWAIYYPVEKMLARLTDCLVTINNEDYELAKKSLKAGQVLKFSGIGVDVSKFKNPDFDREKKYSELNIPKDSFIYLSVGELEKRKNHATVISAFKKADMENSVLLICGLGSQKDYLEALIKKEGLENKVFLLGYRYDIAELIGICDAFVLLSRQEGLSVALMEAMSGGAPCLVSKIRGNTDLFDEGRCVFCNPYSVDACVYGLEAIRTFPKEAFLEYNRQKVLEFDIENVKKMVKATVHSLIG